VDILGLYFAWMPGRAVPLNISAALAATLPAQPGVAAPITSTVTKPTTSTVSTLAPPILSGAPQTYVVVVGDTLFLIAQRFNTTMEAIMQANQLTDADFVWTGQTLIIP
jgi:LysM repeat protein